MKWIDSETGLPIEQAEKIKAIIKKLEEENMRLRGENLMLKSMIEGMGVKREDGRMLFAPGQDPMMVLTADGVLKPIHPNVLRMGDDESYLQDVITGNITIASSIEDKDIAGDADELFARIRLPRPKRYRRRAGRGGEEIGFIAEEMPAIFRRGSGYDLKALVAYLAWKLSMIENDIQRR